ncbi:hypothetical protein M409DRAFT_57749 [Zasmidium cellare ATCC 36951]|uniref:G-patch domain-containing protein n=1 Tax=Zasmidium cellare ATCC 36951 TaxID=1080233 RepID=A0A6A6C8A7_ZASCE|nr:uncharacterized protein M409DRAFT_57749 [Zasmidium cellare ATCC 36951]KAF2163073.1 hypothetical protein M409DRAFT_57749 [Zasmidium cellare ATCC 36951]
MSSQRTNENEEFSIRGAASRAGSHRREERYERSRSPTRRRNDYYDVDAPRGGREYPRRRDDDRHYRPSRDWGPGDTSRARSSDDRASLYSSGAGYSDPTIYNDPEEPPAPNGDGDVATEDSPWKVLLVRGLKPAVDESLLAKGLEKLYLDENEPAPPPPAMPMPPGMPPRQPTPRGAPPNTLRRVFVIRDRISGRSLGFGFAEYHSPADAKAALARAKSLGNSCTISSKQIELCHPHLGIFRPLGLSRDDQQFAFDWNGTNFAYHDTRYYASPQMVNADPPAPPQSQQPPAKEATAKTKKRTKTEAMGTLDNPSEPTKKVKTEIAMVNQLNRAQAQARGEDGEAETNDANPNPDPLSGANHENYTTGTGKEQSFAFNGPDKRNEGKRLVCCFLCNAQFGTDSAKLVAHVQYSAKHAENYKDDKIFKQGLDRMKSRKVDQHQTLNVEMKTSSENGGTQVGQAIQAPAPKEDYRDRAKERRQEEAKARKEGASSEKPTFQKVSLKDAARRGKGGDQQTPNDAAPAHSTMVARNLLKKAGWQEGQALGSGDGITAPIEQTAYAAGVGLGHASSKQGDAIEEAGRQTRNDRGGYADKTKDAFKKMFDDMQGNGT